MIVDKKINRFPFSGFGLIPSHEPFLSSAENRKNYQIAIGDWSYGPEYPTNETGANKSFYLELAKAMQCDEKEARRKHCSNCSNYENGTTDQARLERIPLAVYDEGAGFRGHCKKINFICNDMRVCQAWDEQDDHGYA